MMCPVCGLPSAVRDTRRQTTRHRVWRRRACLECKLTWTTYENLATNPEPIRPKKDSEGFYFDEPVEAEKDVQHE